MTVKERQAGLNHRLKAARNDEAGRGPRFGCECADLRCNALLELTEEERGRRRNPGRFWVKPGHELVSERVVEAGTRYSVVQLEETPLFVISTRS
jgi:hypothetical protein